MVIDVDQKHQIDRRRNFGAVCRAQYRRQISQTFLLRALTEIFHHVRFKIDCIDLAGGQHVRKARREITGTGSDVGDRGIGRQFQRHDNFMRFLPGVARRVVEHLCPFARIVETMIGVAFMLGQRTPDR